MFANNNYVVLSYEQSDLKINENLFIDSVAITILMWYVSMREL